MPETAVCEGVYSRRSAPCKDGGFLYTEEVSGSSPLSPTVKSITYEKFAKFPPGSLNLRTTYARCKNGLKQCANTVSSPDHIEPGWRLAMAKPPAITTALFWSKVNIPEDPSSCWEWTRTLNGNGYGRFRFNGGQMSAHRFAYSLVKDDIPEGMHIRHLCHNRVCCNPAHLEIGTAKENAQDALEAGRFSRGTINGNAKLTDADVLYIRRNPDKLKGRQLAEKFGISPATVSGIRNGRVWRHVA